MSTDLAARLAALKATHCVIPAFNVSSIGYDEELFIAGYIALLHRVRAGKRVDIMLWRTFISKFLTAVPVLGTFTKCSPFDLSQFIPHLIPATPTIYNIAAINSVLWDIQLSVPAHLIPRIYDEFTRN